MYHPLARSRERAGERGFDLFWRSAPLSLTLSPKGRGDKNGVAGACVINATVNGYKTFINGQLARALFEQLYPLLRR